MELPPALRAALDHALASLPTKRLAAASAALSHRYRSAAPPTGPLVLSDNEIAAYAATRLPATYAAVHAALEQTCARLPGWVPRALLDVGAGLGTAAWAAAERWPDLERITLVERETKMIALGRRLAALAECPALRQANWRQADLLGAWDTAPHEQADLVVAAYVLGELTPERVAPLVTALWERAGGVLLLVEPGTPAGFARIRAARDLLLAAGARTAAPCPHDQPCPMPPGDWCHFAQRVARSRLHRQAKGGDLGYEDEKFAFAALTRLAPQTLAPIAARVIRHPQTRPGLVQLELCTPAGLARQTITRKDRERFRAVRDLHWGSALPV